MASNGFTWAETHDKTREHTLCMVWKEADLPMPSGDEVLALYDTAFRPRLERDVIQMHEVLVATQRPTRPVHWAEYYEAIMAIKPAIGDLAIRDLSELDNIIHETQAAYIAENVRNMQSEMGQLYRRWQLKSDNALNETYLARRHACIAFDTSEALYDTSSRFHSIDDMRKLYCTGLEGPEAAKALYAGQWLDDRKDKDLESLRKKMFFARAELVMNERAAHMAEPAENAPVLANADRAQIHILYEHKNGVRVPHAA